MADIVISEFMDDAAVDSLRAEFDVHYDPTLADRQEEIPALLTGARALIVRNRTQVRGALLEAGTALNCIGRLGVGLDNIDVDACSARDIAVFPATGANDASVAEYVIGTAMVLLRGAYYGSDQVAAGSWPRQAMIGREIGGLTLGLIGYGAIAKETASRARALGMHIIAYDPFVETATDAEILPLEDVLSRADVVSLHVPLTDGTRNLLNTANLTLMKPDAVLINAARGGVLDEAAVADALRHGRLGGAALDVFDKEPLGAQNPFSDVPKLILTAHIAGVTEQSNVRVSALTAETVAKHLRG
ncbi:hydroxyacid dehydrogenase [Pontivivens insulae]|uniref:(S)-sulfolactate dehydrogenase n=1 Tax=Pontivivens insulae TaxID=1639689 RepID=A0A2R8A9W1_9RHOB|nr:hydroxyacid dehydrogenase [Pontivivens insulae]RED12779.1 (S)-sulfolactate dehydrogenase [Pontivivens insulae]SPF28870.1 (S)-sulfolactate dehydrogenase [Pontivivens insulae]